LNFTSVRYPLVVLSVLLFAFLGVATASAAPTIGPPVINSGPASPTTATDATFTFTLDIPPPSSTMVAECSLDGFLFTTCASPKTYSNLSPATHQFQVRQKKCKNGVCSRPSAPATYSWTVTGIGISYPASYYTGPLGQGNILPSEDGAFLLAAITAPQAEGTSWSAHQAQILQREQEIGRTYDGLMATDWNFEWPEQHMEWIASAGRIPIVFGLNFGSSAGVLNGSQNFTIDNYANHYEAMPFKVIIRLNHEFNYAGVSYTSVGNTQGFVDAWRYVVNRFQQAGASNVGFWWTPAEGGDQSRAADVASYPGDQYVDWVGSDSYNHCLVGADCYATPYEPGWASFGKVFDYPLGFANLEAKHNTFGDNKPFMVGETGTVYDAAFPSLKGQWYDEIPEYADANMEWLRGVAFFDVNTQEHNEANNWLVDYPISNPSVLQGFRNMAQDPFFNAR
jgi:hypothetical protein